MFFLSLPLPKIRKLSALILYIILSLFFLSLNLEQQRAIKTKVLFLFSPFQRAAASVDTNLLSLKMGKLDLERLQTENQRLTTELACLKTEQYTWKEVARENERLREILEFEKKFPLKLLPAQVIGREATNWNKVIFINKGSADGLKRNFPVITPEGLVGQLLELTPHQSKIMTILDSNSRVAAIIERNRIQGIIYGTNNLWCQLNYISLREEIQEGDLVISSGAGGIFPKGLPIGKVSSVKKKETELFQNIEVEPLVNFSQLEEVMVIINE